MMRLLHSLAVVVLILLSTVAHGQQKGQFLPPDPFVMTSVSYVIDVDITPESSLVAATMQLKYQNTSNDTLTQVWFQAGYNINPVDSTFHDSLTLPDGRCFIDSVSMQGVTVGGDSLTFNGKVMKVRMPSRILPGKTGYFQITFKTKPPAPTQEENDAIVMRLVNWYPKVCRYVDSGWLTDSAVSMRENEGERADYDLHVNIDTSLSLIFAAHLLNEKHHYGLLPRFADGTVYEDFTNRNGMGIDGLKYRSVFDQAKKPYLLRTVNVTGFPVIVSKRLLRDRIRDESLAIEVCYRPSDSTLWGGFVASSAYELMKRLESRLGKLPPRYITIAESDGDDMGALSERLLVMPRTITDPDLLYTALAFQLAAVWPFEKPVDSTSARDGQHDDVHELLTERFAADSDEMIDKYKTWCDKHYRAQGR